MAFALDLDRPIAPQLRTLADAELAKARAGIARPPPELEDGIHAARRALRRSRALVELALPRGSDARDAFETPVRLAGRELSALRDLHSAYGTLAWLADDGRGTVGPSIRAQLALVLAREHRRVMRDAEERIASAGTHLRAAGMASNFVDGDADVDVVAGLSRAYARARRALEVALEAGTEETIHRFRRRARTYHWQLELVRGARPVVAEAEANEVRKLTQAIGQARDLHLMARRLARRRDAVSPAIVRAIGRLEGKAARLRTVALEAARIAFAEARRAHRQRWRAMVAARGDASGRPVAIERAAV